MSSRFAPVLLALAWCSAAPAAANPASRFASPSAWVRSYPAHVARTLRPLGDWKRDAAIGAGVSLVVWASAQADSALERQVREHGPLGHGLDTFGSDGLPWILMAGYLGPVLASDGSWTARLSDTEAFVEAQAAEGLLIQALKSSIDRRRPTGNHYAFPSGHAGFAFASAGLIDGRYGHAAGAVAVTAASFVAITRVSSRRHWVSDTVAGAAIGMSIGELVAAEHRREDRAAQPHAGSVPVTTRHLDAGLGSLPSGGTAVRVCLSF